MPATARAIALPEVVRLVITAVKAYSFDTLKDCNLVNRLWHDETTPHLWSSAQGLAVAEIAKRAEVAPSPWTPISKAVQTLECLNLTDRDWSCLSHLPFDRLEYLVIGGVEGKMSESMKHLLQPNLRRLTLRGPASPPEQFWIWVKDRCPKLEELVFSDLLGTGLYGGKRENGFLRGKSAFADFSVWDYLEHHKRLKKISTSYEVPKLSLAQLQSLSNNPNLQSLELSSHVAPKLYPRSSGYVPSNCISTLFEEVPHAFSKLQILQCTMEIEVIHLLQAHLLNLHSLDVTIAGPSRGAIIAASRFPKLLRLHVWLKSGEPGQNLLPEDDISMLDPTELIELCERRPDLAELGLLYDRQGFRGARIAWTHVFKLTKNIFEESVLKLKDLRALKIDQSFRDTEMTLSELVLLGCLFPRLEVLELPGVYDIDALPCAADYELRHTPGAREVLFPCMTHIKVVSLPMGNDTEDRGAPARRSERHWPALEAFVTTGPDRSWSMYYTPPRSW